MEESKETIKVAVRCKECSHLIAYKMSAASGIIEVKCRKCGTISQINLALRKGKPFVFYRVAKPPIRFSTAEVRYLQKIYGCRLELIDKIAILVHNIFRSYE